MEQILYAVFFQTKILGLLKLIDGTFHAFLIKTNKKTWVLFIVLLVDKDSFV